jgi:hypothetical protein
VEAGDPSIIHREAPKAHLETEALHSDNDAPDTSPRIEPSVECADPSVMNIELEKSQRCDEQRTT